MQEAKRLEVPSGEVGVAGDPLHHPTTKTYHTHSGLDQGVTKVSSEGPPATKSFSIPSPGSVVGTAADLTGAFDLLGDASGALLRTGDLSINPPLDRITVITYWWGYEVSNYPL